MLSQCSVSSLYYDFVYGFLIFNFMYNNCKYINILYNLFISKCLLNNNAFFLYYLNIFNKANKY
jgi:hypothetical protein